MIEQTQPTTKDIIAVAEFRSALRHFLRRSEKIARHSGLTPAVHAADDDQGCARRPRAVHRDRAVGADAARAEHVTELVRRAESAGLIEREQSQRDARVAHLRLTPEGERRLMLSFTELATERAQLRDAFANLDGGVTGH